MPTLLWFRRDVRLGDLPALLDAEAAGRAESCGGRGEVLACYVLDPRLEATAGPRRLQFLYDSLRELRDRLDGRLLVTRGAPQRRIPALANAIGATSVHVSADYSPFGRTRDDAVSAALAPVPLEASGSPYLVSPGRVTKDGGQPYRVFTPYFRRWQAHGWRAPADSGAATAAWLDPARLGGGVDIQSVDIPDPGATLECAAGERAAARRWAEFLDRVDDYDAQRNRPDLDGTSRLSAHLKFGTIHPRTLAADLAQRLAAGSAGANGFLRELAFRDFYAAVLYDRPDSARCNWNRAFDAIEVDDGPEAQRAFAAWKDGRTGFPIVDAGMRQLRQTGFMHNRVRMITASFLVKDLHLPWQWGARWFMEQLVDGDVASNSHGWQWAAGCGTDAAPYFRVFNPTAQGASFDPAGDYVRRWVPELAEPGSPVGYPEPIVDHGEERHEALRRYRRLR